MKSQSVHSKNFKAIYKRDILVHGVFRPTVRYIYRVHGTKETMSSNCKPPVSNPNYLEKLFTTLQGASKNT